MSHYSRHPQTSFQFIRERGSKNQRDLAVPGRAESGHPRRSQASAESRPYLGVKDNGEEIENVTCAYGETEECFVAGSKGKEEQHVGAKGVYTINALVTTKSPSRYPNWQSAPTAVEVSGGRQVLCHGTDSLVPCYYCRMTS